MAAALGERRAAPLNPSNSHPHPIPSTHHTVRVLYQHLAGQCRDAHAHVCPPGPLSRQHPHPPPPTPHPPPETHLWVLHQHLVVQGGDAHVCLAQHHLNQVHHALEEGPVLQAGEGGGRGRGGRQGGLVCEEVGKQGRKARPGGAAGGGIVLYACEEGTCEHTLLRRQPQSQQPSNQLWGWGWGQGFTQQSDHSVRPQHAATTARRTSYMSRSMPCLPEEAAACSASPTPSQAGSTRRVWVQAKIQGMARREVTSLVALRLQAASGGKKGKEWIKAAGEQASYRGIIYFVMS